MTTTDFYGSTADNYAYFSGTTASYPTTSSSVTATSTDLDLYVGQFESGGNFFVYQTGLSFDTSSIGSGPTVSSATLSLYGEVDSSTTDFTIHACIYDWGAAFTAADLRTGAQANALTSVATLSTAGLSIAGYNAFTDVALPANINKTGTTSLILVSSRWMGSNVPSGEERVAFWSNDKGTTFRPKLTVTYATTSIKSVAGVAQASIKSVAGVPIASVKSVAGVT